MADLADSITTENVVTSTSVEQELNLESLNDDLDRGEYNPGRFPGLIYRTAEPKAASLIFRSGEVVTTGAKSEAIANEAVGVLFDDLDDLGVAVPETPSVTVQNIVSSADLGTPLNLNAIAIGLGLEHIEYEPEQFPGLVYRLEDPSIVLLLFGSGKLVITGANRFPDVERALESAHSTLDELGLLG
jgi:transcription initiation factor TFIID TATA-box-binding protein